MIYKNVVQSEETETIWNYSKSCIGEWVETYTTDKVIMRRYEKFAHKHPEHCKLIKEDQYSMTFMIDPKCMGVNPRAPRKGPQLTPDQIQANRERLENIRKKNV